MVNREQPVIFERNLNVQYFLLRPHAVNTHSIYKVAVAFIGVLEGEESRRPIRVRVNAY